MTMLSKNVFRAALTLPLAGAMAMSIALGGSARAQTRTQTESQTQTQTQTQERIYGSQLMTPRERLEYRNRMRDATSQAERERIRAEHHQEMQERARQRGVALPDMPPAVGQSGMGTGMGPGMGSGMGGGRR